MIRFPSTLGFLEVDQKAKPESGGTQIIQTLRGVLVGETFHALQFHDQDAGHDDRVSLIADSEGSLGSRRDAPQFQFW
jgi:hypothetical protein